jgi:hypothetical protein
MATKRARSAPKAKTVTGAQVRMYRLGTGDCFVIKFLSGKTVTFKMMIDCGALQGTKATFTKHVADLMKYVGNQVDVLAVTHEHQDHVLGFERCESLFTDGFTVGEKWMSWAEDDSAPAVKKLKKDHGQKKRALAAASGMLASVVADPTNRAILLSQHRGFQHLAAYQHFSTELEHFRDLHMAVEGGTYVGPLKGMEVFKNKIPAIAESRYFKPGEVIEDVPGLEGIRIHVLGPPSGYDAIKAETSRTKGESYDHNKDLARSEAFAAAAVGAITGNSSALRPFDRAFEAGSAASPIYDRPADAWRRIDNDWLMSAGTLALRLNEGINNLSLVLAIEFVKSGKVMLFPGDAEYGSWASWHNIKWEREGTGKNADGKPKHLTEDLLNRTVFYKVAHHLSHNGTAKRRGLEMMNHKDLVAMATLDYNVISEGWKGTMPNRAIVDDLLRLSKGRLIVMNPKDTLYDPKTNVFLETRIKRSRKAMSASELRAFQAASVENRPLWIDFTVKA